MAQPLRTSRAVPTLETQVAVAKALMRDRGFSMTDAARHIGVMPNELDAALWRFLGTPPEDLMHLPRLRPEPMF